MKRVLGIALVFILIMGSTATAGMKEWSDVVDKEIHYLMMQSIYQRKLIRLLILENRRLEIGQKILADVYTEEDIVKVQAEIKSIGKECNRLMEEVAKIQPAVTEATKDVQTLINQIGGYHHDEPSND